MTKARIEIPARLQPVFGPPRGAAQFRAMHGGRGSGKSATAALIACGCQQYRMCHTGQCPVGIATQDPESRSRFDMESSIKHLANYLNVCTNELKDFARITGNDQLRNLSIEDLCTTNREISDFTDIEHV